MRPRAELSQLLLFVPALTLPVCSYFSIFIRFGWIFLLPDVTFDCNNAVHTQLPLYKSAWKSAGRWGVCCPCSLSDALQPPAAFPGSLPTRPALPGSWSLTP